MIKIKDKKILVMGLGLNGGGVAITRWLVKKGARVMVTDLKKKSLLKDSIDKLKGLPITYILGRHREKDFKNIDFIVQNPGVPKESKFLKIAEKNKIEIYNEASLFFSFINPQKIIGVTGTRGKSTVTTIIYNILKKKYPKTLFGGNIRTKVMFDIIDKVKDNYVVLELSSWQLEGLEKIKKSPHLSVLTNIMEDHLNRYKNLDEYIKAKKNIIKFQNQKDYSIFNKENKIAKKIGKTTISQRYWVDFKFFPEENGVFIKNDWIYFRENGQEIKVIEVKDIHLLGEHNLFNVLFAIAGGMILKVGIKNIQKAIKNFQGLENRLEFVSEIKGVKYFNDTTSTTPEATIAALKTINKKNIILLAGGSDKKLKYKKFAQVAKKYCKKIILFQGQASKKIKKELLVVGYKNFFQEFSQMDKALLEAIKSSQKGDIILLSPGAASFGVFVNEFDRGKQFKKFLNKIK